LTESTEPTSAEPASPVLRGPPRGERGATARGARTRERLLDAAEGLWAERGVEAVSLREIRLAAGQRNNSALQFHFGDRDGLLQALVQRHLPPVEALREQLYVRLVAEGRQTDFAALVEVMVRPHAEYMRRGPSERAWAKILAELGARPGVSRQDMIERVPPTALHVGLTLHEQLTSRIGPELAVERLMSVLNACDHLCADRARLEDTPPPAPERRLARPTVPFDAWLGNLLDMAVGALLAPARH
jgi:AcrR family transcriptional regulator